MADLIRAGVKIDGGIWTVEEAAAYLGWTVEQVRKRLKTQKYHASLCLIAAKGEPHDRHQVGFVTRSSVLRVARFLAGREP